VDLDLQGSRGSAREEEKGAAPRNKLNTNREKASHARREEKRGPRPVAWFPSGVPYHYVRSV